MVPDPEKQPGLLPLPLLKHGLDSADPEQVFWLLFFHNTYIVHKPNYLSQCFF